MLSINNNNREENTNVNHVKSICGNWHNYTLFVVYYSATQQKLLCGRQISHNDDSTTHSKVTLRKRGRNIREDEVEFMPLSKRINNLHINGSMFFDAQSTELNASGWGPGPPCYNGNVSYTIPDTPPEPIQNYSNVALQYNPVLNASENPHYFYKNKLLFEMHLERMQRTNQ
ncbi:hypothetical protein FQR65_LT08625 [Abscondita terminalis]|nr:hypothetical protein FQR65_LT08625 [Abscondita terminalis]